MTGFTCFRIPTKLRRREIIQLMRRWAGNGPNKSGNISEWNGEDGEDRLPLAHGAGVEMNEAGLRVIAHAAAAQRQRRRPEPGKRDAGQSHVDGFPLHMQALARHATALLMQCGIGFRRAVAGNDLEGSFRAQGAGNLREQIQQPDIDAPHLVVPEIAQQQIQFLACVREVAAGFEICDREPLAGMRVAKGE